MQPDVWCGHVRICIVVHRSLHHVEGASSIHLHAEGTAVHERGHWMLRLSRLEVLRIIDSFF